MESAAMVEFGNQNAQSLRSSAVPKLRGSAAPREKNPSRTCEEALADAKRSLSGPRELRARHSGENSNAEPRNCGQEPATAVSSQGVVEAVNGDAPVETPLRNRRAEELTPRVRCGVSPCHSIGVGASRPALGARASSPRKKGVQRLAARRAVRRGLRLFRHYRSIVPSTGREYASSGAGWKRSRASGSSRKPL